MGTATTPGTAKGMKIPNPEGASKSQQAAVDRERREQREAEHDRHLDEEELRHAQHA